MDIIRNMNGARALVVGAGLALALAMGAAPTPAMAAGRVGTTKVMVRTEIDNVEFKVPTVIPFVAKADGTLQGPSEDATTIDNHSAYGIHVTNMKIDAMNTWTIAADAKAGTAQNSIDFKVGPDGALQNASAQCRRQASIFPRTQPSTWATRALPAARTKLSSRQAETSPASRATSSA